jgi:hypothetical protein
MKHGSFLPPTHQDIHALPPKTATPGARRLLGMDAFRFLGLLPFLLFPSFLFTFLSFCRAPVRAVKALLSFFLVDGSKNNVPFRYASKGVPLLSLCLEVSMSMLGAPIHARRKPLPPRDELLRSHDLKCGSASSLASRKPDDSPVYRLLLPGTASIECASESIGGTHRRVGNFTRTAKTMQAGSVLSLL